MSQFLEFVFLRNGIYVPNRSNQDVLDSEIPFFSLELPGTAFDWNYTTTPQSGLGGRSLPYPRGHIQMLCSILADPKMTIIDGPKLLEIRVGLGIACCLCSE